MVILTQLSEIAGIVVGLVVLGGLVIRFARWVGGRVLPGKLAQPDSTPAPAAQGFRLGQDAFGHPDRPWQRTRRYGTVHAPENDPLGLAIPTGRIVDPQGTVYCFDRDDLAPGAFWGDVHPGDKVEFEVLPDVSVLSQMMPRAMNVRIISR